MTISYLSGSAGSPLPAPLCCETTRLPRGECRACHERAWNVIPAVGIAFMAVAVSSTATGAATGRLAPAALLSAPAAGEIVSNVLRGGESDAAVSGTAAGVGLKGWVLEFGGGASPKSWTRIAVGSHPVVDGSLAVWRTEALANGTYTIRLTVTEETGTQAAAVTTVVLENFGVSQDALEFNPADGKTVSYTSVVPFALTETLVIKDRQGEVVRTLLSTRRSAGNYVDAWDGRNDAGALVPDGPYFYVASVTDGVHSLVWDLTSQFLSNYFDSKDSLKIAPFDPFDNRPMTFTYNSVVPGNVTISVFNKSLSGLDCDQPPEKVLCLVNRKYEESGPHTFVWAGVDASGVYRADAYSLLSVTTVRDRFAKNAVVVFGTKPTLHNVAITPPAFAVGLATPTVSFDLATYQSQPAHVTIAFLNQTSLSTLRTIALEAVAPGHVSVPWDGRAENGALVAPGFYTITVTATDRIGNRVRGQILATVQR